MSDAPFFSVVIPVYNRADVLGRPLRSVLAQSFRDFEIVVVDDGSHDDPRAVIDALNDPRIRYIQQENKGGAAARNRGFDEARGRFVALLDSDDIFLPHHLEEMHRLLNGTSKVVGYSRIIVDRGDGVTILKPPRAIRVGEDMANYLFCDRGFVPIIGVVVDAQTARRVRFSEGWRIAEDSDFAIRLALDGNSFRMLEAPGAVWNDQHDPNRTSAGRKGARLIPWLEAMKAQIPKRAYYGCRGWPIAKGVAVEHPWRAFRYWLDAVVHGCYNPRLAVVVFLQIFLGDGAYRNLANRLAPFMWRVKAPIS
jgi:glycosyltransferase involved in cell wall biosynthesis